MKRLVLIAMVLLLSSSIGIAQDFCKGDLDYDGDVDGEDVTEFLNHFGRGQYSDPCPPDGPTPVRRTGQTASYATGDDGDLVRGVPLVSPRFTDNLDGTVTDNQTGLIWLKNANCFSIRTWNNALSDCNALANGSCDLTDGSNPGDWRLPHLFELESLRNMKYFFPVLSNTAGTDGFHQDPPFNNVQQFGSYWSSTSFSDSTLIHAWFVRMDIGYVSPNEKSNAYYVWPVRGGR